MSDLYNRIENLCKRDKVNITTMCKESGASRASLTDLKMGRKQSLSSDTLSKISAFFNVSIDYLLTGEQKEKAPTPEGERELPHANYRDVLQEGGIRLLLDADTKVSKEDLDDIVEFIKFKQRKNGR